MVAVTSTEVVRGKHGSAVAIFTFTCILDICFTNSGHVPTSSHLNVNPSGTGAVGGFFSVYRAISADKRG